MLATADALVAAVPAAAQTDESTPSTSSMEEIVVTVRRVEERLQDAPISIAVFDQEPHTNRNITTVSQVAAYTSRGGQRTFRARQGIVLDPRLPHDRDHVADRPRLSRAIAGTASGNGAGPGDFFDLNLDWKSVFGSRVDLAAFVTNLTKEEFPINISCN
jgi:iron complex outermembrane receptor protein